MHTALGGVVWQRCEACGRFVVVTKTCLRVRRGDDGMCVDSAVSDVVPVDVCVLR